MSGKTYVQLKVGIQDFADRCGDNTGDFGIPDSSWSALKLRVLDFDTDDGNYSFANILARQVAVRRLQSARFPAVIIDNPREADLKPASWVPPSVVLIVLAKRGGFRIPIVILERELDIHAVF